MSGTLPAAFALLLAALSAFGPIGTDLMLPALPAIERELAAAPGRIHLTLSAFFLGFGLGQLLYGPLSDALGRKRPLLAGLALFVLASALSAATTDIGPLIALRLVQGLTACAGPVLARAMVADLFAREQAARALSVVTSISWLAPMLAPLAGGYLLIGLGWRAIFWAMALFGLICVAGAAASLKETLPSERRTRLSLRQALGRYRYLIAERGFRADALPYAFGFAGLYAYIAGSPSLFIAGYGVPPQHYGLLFGLNVLGMIAAASINARLVRRVGSGRMLGIGIAGVALSASLTGALALAGDPGGLPPLAAALFAYTFSLGLVAPNAMASALSAYRQMAGTASALAGALQFGFGAICAALVGALQDGSSLPMAGAIAAAGLLCLLSRLLSGRSRPRAPALA